MSGGRLAGAETSGPSSRSVASATWFAAIDGFFSTASSSSTSVGVGQLPLELAELLLGVARGSSRLTSRFLPLT